MAQRILLSNVREYCEKYPVELVQNEQTMGRWGIRAVNEGGNNEVIIDLFDLLEWLRHGLVESQIDGGFQVTFDDDPSNSA